MVFSGFGKGPERDASISIRVFDQNGQVLDENWVCPIFRDVTHTSWWISHTFERFVRKCTITKRFSSRFVLETALTSETRNSWTNDHKFLKLWLPWLQKPVQLDYRTEIFEIMAALTSETRELDFEAGEQILRKIDHEMQKWYLFSFWFRFEKSFFLNFRTSPWFPSDKSN